MPHAPESISRSISALENGDHDPGLGHLSRLLAATGTPAGGVAAALLRGDEPSAFREFIQLFDDLVAKRAPDPVSALLIGRLGVDERHEGLGIGTELVKHILAAAIIVKPNSA